MPGRQRVVYLVAWAVFFFLLHLLCTEAFCLYSLTFTVLAQLSVMNAPLFQTVLEEITSIHSAPSLLSLLTLAHRCPKTLETQD